MDAVDQVWSSLQNVYDDVTAMSERGISPAYEPVWNELSAFDRFLVEETYPELYSRLEDFSDTVERFKDDVNSSTIDADTVDELAAALDHPDLYQSGEPHYVDTGYHDKRALDDYLDRFKVEIATSGSRDELAARCQHRNDYIDQNVEQWHPQLWEALQDGETAIRDQIGSDNSWPMYYVEIMEDAEELTALIEERAHEDLLD